MLSDEVIEKVIERLVRRMEQANEYVLQKIGESVKKIGTLTPSKAQELAQILKYGGDYDKIVKKLAEITKLNVKDIKKIFEEVAKHDYQFAKQFYDYRGKKFIPYEKNEVLKRQVDALANMTAKTYVDLSRSDMLGFGMVDKKGNMVFKGLKQAYNELLDEAILNVGQGKETFNSAMFRQLKQMGAGLKVQYESGRTMRLDSAVRMNMKDAIRSLHNETQELFGKEFDANGVEITVHENPAPDHEEAQGKQFSKEEYKKLQEDGIATTYDKIEIDLHMELKSGETAEGFRPISQYNCYHYTFAIVLGISKPEYTNEELKQIIDRNNKGFDYEGKHYTMYEGTQLQRQLERAIREQKDTQILARASGNEMLIGESQQRITILTRKYKEVCEASGLPIKNDRLRVSGYHRMSVKIENTNAKTPEYDFTKFRENIDKYNIAEIKNNFDYKGFIDEYNKFYNSLDKNELQKAYNKYSEWVKTDMNTSHPIGEYLNEKTNYNKLPELIDKKEFWKDEDGKYNTDPIFLDDNHWYRGITAKRYSNVLNAEVPDIDKIKKFTNDFKYGDYFAGKGINGNGTYATYSYSYARNYNDDIDEGMIYIMPKENAKIIDIDKIATIKQKLIRYVDSDDDLYVNIATILLDDNGYIAQILGYDIVNLGQHKIILNRSSVKVVK